MDSRDRVVETITGMSPEIVAFAGELIAIPTENPPGVAYRRCVEAIERHLHHVDLPVELLELSSEHVAVIAGAGTGPTLYLHGHYDVVPASVPGQFDPALQGTRLMGRGSADMKGAVASMVYALVALSELQLRGRVELVVVPDEETGGAQGSRRLLEMGRLGRDGVGAILGEPTSGVVWNANRGAITLRIKVAGRPAHVGLQHEGVNAFEGAIPILVALRDLKEQVEAHRTGFNIEPEAARSSILMLGGEVQGGHQFNVVPSEFSFTVERRFNPEEDLAEERTRLLGVVEAAKPAWVDVDVCVLQEAESSAVGEDGDLGPVNTME